jgi:PIN domain nuclease of toxin-antitoxin system
MMRLLLDTHVLVWWLLGEGALAPAQEAALESAETRGEILGLAAISMWEIAKLCERARLVLATTPDSFLERVEMDARLAVLPLDARVALESTRLGPRFHRDPADQLIAATARVHGLRLVTADERIRASRAVAVL